jgi:excisionase family DNA binding protein
MITHLIIKTEMPLWSGYFKRKEEIFTEEKTKLYSSSDVARLTGKTLRGVREMLKSNKIKGTKLGGQWLFSEEEIEKILSEQKVLEQTVIYERENVSDFVNGTNTEISGKLQLCLIADLYTGSKEEARSKAEELVLIIENGGFEKSSKQQTFSYEYSDKEKKARFTIIGSVSFVTAVLKGLEG